jgi:hypothetical protein
MIRPRLTLALALVVALAVAGCATHTIHTAAVVSEQAGSGLLAAQRVVTTAYTAGAISEPVYLSLQSRFEQIASIGLAANQALREGNEQRALAQIAAGLKVVEAAILVDIPKISESNRALVLIAVQAVRSGLLAYAAALGGLPVEVD